MDKKDFLKTVKNAVKTNMTDLFLLNYYKLGAKAVINAIKKIKKKKKQKKLITNEDFTTHYQQVINTSRYTDKNNTDENKPDETLQIEPPKEEAPKEPEETQIEEPEETQIEQPKEETQIEEPEETQIEEPKEIKLNENESLSIIDLISENYSYLNISNLSDELLKEIETYYNNNYNGDYNKFLNDFNGTFTNIYELGLKDTDYSFNELSDTYKSYILGEYIDGLVNSNFDFNEINLNATNFYDINKNYYDIISNLATIATEEDLTKNNDEYNIYGNQEETIKLNENESLSIIDLISDNYTYLNISNLSDELLKEIETYYNNNYNGDYNKFLNDFNGTFTNIYELGLKDSDYSFNELSDTYKSYILGEYIDGLVNSNFDFSDIDLTSTNFYDINKNYYDIISNLATIATEEDLTKDNSEYDIYGLPIEEDETLKLEPEETISIEDIISEYYDYLNTSKISDSIMSKIETYYNENYDGNYEKFLNDIESSYKNMYELALQNSNYSYDDLSDDFKSYFLSNYLYALGRSNGDFSDLDYTKVGSDNDYYQSVVNSLILVAQEEDLTKDNDDYNLYGQQELLLDPVEVELNPDGTIKEGQDPSQTASDIADILKGDTTKTESENTYSSVYDAIKNNFWYYNIDSFDKDSAWSILDTYYNNSGYTDYDSYIKDLNWSYMGFYEDVLSQLGVDNYDSLSESYKSFLANEYFSVLLMNSGDFSKLVESNKVYNAVSTGVVQQLKGEDLTLENADYANLKSYAVEPTDGDVSDKTDTSKTASDLVNILKGDTDKTDGDVSDKTDTSKTAEDLVTIIENKTSGTTEIKDELRQLQEVETNTELAIIDEGGELVETGETSQSVSYSLNNNRNIMQQTDYMGAVDINIKDENKHNNEKLFEISNYAKFNGNDIYHIYDNNINKKVSNEEWGHIMNSYEYDKNIRMTDEIKQKYGGSFDNVMDYYAVIGINNNIFKYWLDRKIKGIESKSFLQYLMPDGEFSNGLNFNNHNKDYNSHKKDVEIKEIENMGFNNVGSFLLCGSIVSFFSTIILKNIKEISNIPIIQQYESAGDKKDLLASGLYSNGSTLNDLLKKGNLSEGQRKVIEESIKSKTYKNLSQYRINNRYGAIISTFFGNLDERQHALKNNSGLVLFNIILVCLGYIASFMDQIKSMNIDEDMQSNLVKIISGVLSYLYPNEKYDGELIRGIDLVLNNLKSEIKNIHHGTNTATNLQTFMNSVISQLVHFCFSMTSTDFNVENFINKNTREHIINNFGSQIYYNLSTPRGLIDMLSEGFVDNLQFNQYVKNLMVITLSDHYEYDGVDLFDVYFMSKVQAMMLLNNNKKNHLITVLHPELVSVMSIIPVNVQITTFDPEIVGFIDYYEPEPINIYDEFIKKEIETYEPFNDENIFLTEEEAEKHKDYVNKKLGKDAYKNIEKVEGGYIAGSEDERDKLNKETFLDITGVDEELVKKGGRDDIVGGVVSFLPNSDEFEDENIIDLNDDKDYKGTQLLEFLNINYYKTEDELKDELNEIIKDSNDKMIFFGKDAKDYMMIKDNKENKLFITFRGSKTPQDWLKNIIGGLSPYHHLGVGIDYKNNKEDLFKNIKKLTNEKTKIIIYSHSRGHGMMTYLLSDLDEKYKNIKAVSFGGYDVLTKKTYNDAKLNINNLNEKIKKNNIQVLNYVDENDEIEKYINNYLGYSQFGKKILIKYSKENNDNDQDIEKKIINNNYGKKHNIDNYKKLLKNDYYLNFFKNEIKESKFNEYLPNNKILQEMLLYIGSLYLVKTNYYNKKIVFKKIVDVISSLLGIKEDKIKEDSLILQYEQLTTPQLKILEEGVISPIIKQPITSPITQQDIEVISRNADIQLNNEVQPIMM